MNDDRSRPPQAGAQAEGPDPKMPAASGMPPGRRAAPEPSLCPMVVGLLRFGLALVAVLTVLAVASELVLRAGGLHPRPPAELARIVPDGWTGFRLRPGVAGEEALATNDAGMHAARSYPLARPPGSLRVAVLGSSVVYGVAAGFADTIPAVVERKLREAGHRAEALNFGTHGFTIANVSAQLQAYVHRFQPDAVVVTVDLQVGQTLLALRPPGRGRGRGDREARLGKGARQARFEAERAAHALRRPPAGATVGPAHHRPAPPAAVAPEPRRPGGTAGIARRRRRAGWLRPSGRECAGGRACLRGEARA